MKRTSIVLTFAMLLLGRIDHPRLSVQEKVIEAAPPASAPAVSRTGPAPADNPTTPDKVALGKQLFFDPRLSGDNKTSCATCHRPDRAFGDGLSLARGAGNKPLKRNTPSLLNVAFYSGYFWDGRAGSLEGQALMPIQAPDEMNQSLPELEKELNAIPGYVKQFRSVFGTEVTRAGIGKALAAFQRTLVTGPSPYDRYLAGNKKALSEQAKRGMDLFFGSAECSTCHKGLHLSDGKFYRLGISADPGRGAVTGNREDRYRFRTPSLRHVARTGPYMHDGSMKTLGDVVSYYYRNVPRSGAENSALDVAPLLGNSFSEIADVVAFLEALTGVEPTITPPQLP